MDYVEKAVLQEDHNSRKECTYNNNISIINRENEFDWWDKKKAKPIIIQLG